jgi:hypothetical protein
MGMAVEVTATSEAIRLLLLSWGNRLVGWYLRAGISCGLRVAHRLRWTRQGFVDLLQLSRPLRCLLAASREP